MRAGEGKDFPKIYTAAAAPAHADDAAAVAAAAAAPANPLCAEHQPPLIPSTTSFVHRKSTTYFTDDFEY